MNHHQFLADLIVAVHACYVAFVVFSVPAILFGAWRGYGWVRNFWFRVIHLFATVVVPLEAVCGILCPLTDWENQLRRQAGQTAEQGTFIGRWAHRLIYVDISPEMLIVGYCLFAAVVIVMFVIIRPRRPRLFARKSDVI